MTCSINNMDPTWLKGYWAPRFEWGSLSQHRLALGIRRFDSVCMKPSPWAKPPRHKNAHQLAFVNNHRTELEHLNSFLGESLHGVVPISNHALTKFHPCRGRRCRQWPHARCVWRKLGRDLLHPQDGPARGELRKLLRLCLGTALHPRR